MLGFTWHTIGVFCFIVSASGFCYVIFDFFVKKFRYRNIGDAQNIVIEEGIVLSEKLTERISDLIFKKKIVLEYIKSIEQDGVSNGKIRVKFIKSITPP